MSKFLTAVSAMVLALLTGCASSDGGFVGTAAFHADGDPAMHTAAWPYQRMTID